TRARAARTVERAVVADRARAGVAHVHAARRLAAAARRLNDAARARAAARVVAQVTLAGARVAARSADVAAARRARHGRVEAEDGRCVADGPEVRRVAAADRVERAADRIGVDRAPARAVPFVDA